MNPENPSDATPTTPEFEPSLDPSLPEDAASAADLNVAQDPAQDADQDPTQDSFQDAAQDSEAEPFEDLFQAADSELEDLAAGADDAGSLPIADDLEHDEALVDEFGRYEALEEELAGDETPSPPKQRQAAAMRLEAKVEAIVFAAQKPLKAQEILDVIQDPSVREEDVQTTLDQLVDFYEDRGGGFRLHYLKRLGYQFQTAETAGAIMERMFASRPRPISRAALETLAIIAYRQPVTRAEVEFIRGVDAGSIFKTLLERELIKCTGRKEIVGRPMLFGTTDQFLTVFNLSSIKDLPPLESFQPSRDMVQGAMARIEGGAANDIVDVEEYIADSTRAEYEGDDLGSPGATAEGGAETSEATGALVPGSEDGDGEGSDTEVAFPSGDSFAPRGRDVDP